MNAGTYKQNFHLGGIGAYGHWSDSTNPKRLGTIIAGWNDKSAVTVNLDNRVELLDDATVLMWYNYKVLKFNNEIYGRGGLSVKGDDRRQFVKFYGVNTFEGPVKGIGTANMIVYDNGAIGGSDISLEKDSMLYFETSTGTAINGEVSGSGVLGLHDAKVELKKKAEVGSLRLYENSELTLNDDVRAGTVIADPVTAVSAAEGTSPTVKIGEDTGTSALTAELKDGVGMMNLHKVGSNTLEIAVQQTYTGKTTIQSGTLKLAPAFTNSSDVAYWFDASDASTIDLDSENKVTAWRAKNDADIVAASAYGPMPSVTGTMNGLSTVTFNSNSNYVNKAAFLKANKSFTQRVVFLVLKPQLPSRSNASNIGVFGINGLDCGLRGSIWGWNWDASGAAYNTTGKGRVYYTGTKDDSQPCNRPQIITLIHNKDNFGGQYSSFSDFIPTLGGYATWGNASNDYLSYSGDMSEVIAFKRLLTEDEMKCVENYLAQKWFNETVHEDVAEEGFKTDILPVATDLEICASSVLDLNGVDQTIKSLTGQGRIINSSSKPATLTVTDSTQFNGSIGNGVILRKADTGSNEFKVSVEEGGMLSIAGGGSVVNAFNENPVTNGMTLWLDASYKPDEMMLTNDVGRITNWICRAGASRRWVHNNGSFKSGGVAYTGPSYVAEGMNGKPSVLFEQTDNLYTSLKSSWEDTSTHGIKARTFFIVAEVLKSDGRYLFGPQSNDRGIRCIYSSETRANLYVFGRSSLFHPGDRVRVNEKECYGEDGEIHYVAPKFCLAGTMQDSHSFANSKRHWVLGCYFQAPFRGYISEVITYDRKLSEHEFLQVEDYLMNKWFRTDKTWEENYSTPFEAGSGISVEGGARLDLNGADTTLSTLTAGDGSIENYGSLTISDSIIIPVKGSTGAGTIDMLTIAGNLVFGENAKVVIDDYLRLKTDCRHNALKIDGTVTGDLSKTNIMHPAWGWNNDNGTWFVRYNAGTIVIIR